MNSYLTIKNNELRGMSSVRFMKDDIVPYTTTFPDCCKRAGYIFTFNDGNNNRFNASGVLSELAMKRPSREDFLTKHAVYIFSVEEIGDDVVGEIKRYRTFWDVIQDIGSTCRKKKGGKLECIIKRDMPNVGQEKRFETYKGVFMVTNLC